MRQALGTISDEDWEELVEQADQDNDGQIDLEEFQNFMRNHLFKDIELDD